MTYPQDMPVDPTALAKFGRLEVVAKLLVEGFQMGQHKSPYKGSSIEFVEHRAYYPGDEVRHIDWRVYGKTGRYFIKEFEDETNLRCYVLLDASGSMGYAGRTISKFDYARQLAAALGYLLLHQRDAIGAITFDSQVRDRLEPSSKPQNFSQLMQILETRRTGHETSLAKVFSEIAPTLKRRSLLVILSDCFDQLDPLRTALNHFRHQKHEIILFHILAPEEKEFPFGKPTQFRSLERAGHRILTDPHRLRQVYLTQFEEFCQKLRNHVLSVGADYCQLVTTEPYQTAFAAYLNSRATRRG